MKKSNKIKKFTDLYRKIGILSICTFLHPFFFSKKDVKLPDYQKPFPIFVSHNI